MIKRMLQELKEYKRPSLQASAFMIGEVVLELMLPFLMSFIVDRGVYQKDMQAVFFYGFLMVIAAFISLFFGYMSANKAAYAGAGFVRNLREAQFRNIQSFSFANIDKFETSGLVTRMMTDATNVQMAYQMIIRLGVRAPLMLIVATFMTFYINSRLALVFLVAIIFLGGVLTLITLKSYPKFSRAFNRIDDLNGRVQEDVTNIRIVKAYVKEEKEKKKFQKAAHNLRMMFQKADLIVALNSPFMQLTMYGCMLALSWFGAHFIVVNEMTTGELMSMFTYVMNVMISLMMLSMIFTMMSMSFASGNRIVAVLNEKPAITNPEKPVRKVDNGAIDFKNVYFSYYGQKDNCALDNINLHINSGETVGILGPTGSSKTTLVNMLPRLYDVTEGSVAVGGIDVRNYDLTALRENVSVVLQKNVLFSGTVSENLRWGNPDASLTEIKEACRLACADEFIEQMDGQYDAHVDQGGANFSGGQKQRLCIARALLKKPKVLILDDSTSAVDTRTDRMIQEGLNNSMPATTKLIISQRITSIQSANRILVMEDGRIIGNGTHDDLLKTNQLYQQIYDTQKKGDD